jgi:hypothetical protein
MDSERMTMELQRLRKEARDKKLEGVKTLPSSGGKVPHSGKTASQIAARANVSRATVEPTQEELDIWLRC